MMYLKKSSKYIVMLVVVLVVFAITIAIVQADSYAGWTAPEGSYSPFAGIARAREWVSGWVYVEGRMERFFWHPEGHNSIEAIISYYENNGYYWTADLKNVTDYALHAFGWYGTNLPDPHYDTDDDPEPWGNGFNDEAEVTVLDPYALSSTTEYYFWNQWRDTSNGNASGYIMVTSQMSEYDWITGEYNTVIWDELIDRPGLYWDTHGLSTHGLSPSISVSTKRPRDSAVQSSGRNSGVASYKRPRTAAELERYLQEALARQRELATSEAEDVEIPITITFVEPQPLTVVPELVARYQMQAKRFDARAFNGVERITIGGMVNGDGTVDQALLQKSLESSNAGNFAGIISLTGTIPAGTLLAVQQDERVFLADVPLPPAFRNARNRGDTIKPPPSIYWVLENVR